MIAIPLLLAASLSGAVDEVDGTPDTIFKDGFEILAAGCPSAVAGAGGSTLPLLITSDITYGVFFNQFRADWPVTEWNKIWGHGTDSDPETPWPGVNGAGPVIRDMGRYNYLAARFHTGPSSNGLNGYLTYATNIGGPNIDLRISQTCGDFSSAPANPACSKANAASDGNPSIRWWVKQGNVNTYCNLQPNTDYFLNVRFTNPTSTVECRADQVDCPLYLVSNWGQL